MPRDKTQLTEFERLCRYTRNDSLVAYELGIPVEEVRARRAKLPNRLCNRFRKRLSDGTGKGTESGASITPADVLRAQNLLADIAYLRLVLRLARRNPAVVPNNVLNAIAAREVL